MLGNFISIVLKTVNFLMPSFIKRKNMHLVKQMRNFRILSARYAQYESIRLSTCIDAKNDAIPWYTYPALEFLSNLNFQNAKIFEYGSGNSSIWWLGRAAYVCSVEHDKDWYQLVRGKVGSEKFEYILSPITDYPSQIAKRTQMFDVIIIDGEERADCAKYVIDHIKHYGGRILILDNSDWYPSLVNHIQKKLGWVRADMHGFSPINDYTLTTSIWINQSMMGDLYDKPLKASVGAIPGYEKQVIFDDQ